MNQKALFSTITDTVIRLGFLLLLIYWCLDILSPFITPLVWAIVIGISLGPIHKKLSSKIGESPKLASLIIVTIILAVLYIPATLVTQSIFETVSTLKAELNAGTIKIPTPQARFADLPLIGDKIFVLWEQAHQNLDGVFAEHQSEVRSMVKTVIKSLLVTGTGILQFTLSVIIAGVLLATPNTSNIANLFFKKLVGIRSEEFVETSEKTILNVTKGILGVALIQGIILGLGFYLANIPYAGVWTILAIGLGVVQLPVIVVIVPAVVYLYGHDTVTTASLWTIYFFLGSLSDNVLKPILLGKGAPVPMLIIFLGAIGGFIATGFLGLFTGAIILSLGYKLFLAWLEQETQEN